MLLFLATFQSNDPWITLSAMGSDPRLEPIWSQLVVDPESDRPRPSTMAVYRQLAQRSEKLPTVFARCATAPIPEPPSPLVEDANYLKFLSGVKMGYRLMLAKSAVDFYDGGAEEGARLLAQGLQGAMRFQETSALGGLVGCALESLVLADYEKRLGRLSVAQLDEISGLTKDWLGKPPPFIAALERDRITTAATFDAWWRDPAPEVRAKRDMLPSAQRDSAGSAVRAAIDKAYERTLARLRLPESAWVKPLTAKKAPVDALDELALTAYGLSEDQTGSVVAKGRTQLRLLRLHALVRGFRWRYDKWPASLEAAAKGESMDPVANQPFTYRLEAGSYYLRSEGWPAIGPLELRYRGRNEAGGAEAGV